MKVSLLVTKDDKSTVSFPITTAGTLGRQMGGYEVVLRYPEGKEEPLGISDPSISRKHAMVYIQEGKLFIKDLGSSTGTLVNNRPIPNWTPKQESAPLEIKGDASIKLGSLEMELKVEVPKEPEIYAELIKMAQEKLKLEEALRQKHPGKVAQKLASSFRVILEIKDNYCNTQTKMKELNTRLESLKMYLAGYEEFLTEVEKIQRKFVAELFAEETLSEKHIRELKDFCTRFTEMWNAKFMKEGPTE